MHWRHATAEAPRGRVVSLAALALAVAFPVVYAPLTAAVLYDGMRHFTFVVLLACAAAACGMAALLHRRDRLAAGVGVLALASMILTLVDMVRLHPYEYIYFNHAIAGGLRVAAKSYETDYWGASDREGALWLVDNYALPTDHQPLRVASCMEPTSTRYYLPADRFTYVKPRNDPDLFLGNPRLGCDTTVAGTTVHVVERMGVPLLYLKEITPRAAAARNHTETAAETVH